VSDADYAQDQPFTIRGHWWLPGTPHKIAGNLIYDEESLGLELYGGLNDAKVTSLLIAEPEIKGFPIVHVETLDKFPITLVNTFYTGWQPDTPQLPFQEGASTELLSSRLDANGMLLGVHLSSLGDRFTKCRLEVPNFETWLGDQPFKVEMESAGRTVRVEYSRPDNEGFSLGGSNCRIRVVRAVKPPGFPSHTPSIEHRAYVEIEPSAGPVSVTWFRNHAEQVVDLLSILYGDNLLSRRFWLFQPSGDAAATVYYPRHKVALPEYRTMDIVFRFEKLKPVFHRLLENWLGASEVARRARRMLVSSERRPSTFIELRFLPLAHAAEVLTKEIKHATIVDPTRFSEVRTRMVDAMPDDVPQELVDAVKVSLGYANGHTLHRKLMNMLNELSEETCRLFCVDNTTFTKGIVDTRNYYTHYSTKSRRLQKIELHWAIRKLSLMLRILLLLKAGVAAFPS